MLSSAGARSGDDQRTPNHCWVDLPSAVLDPRWARVAVTTASSDGVQGSTRRDATPGNQRISVPSVAFTPCVQPCGRNRSAGDKPVVAHRHPHRLVLAASRRHLPSPLRHACWAAATGYIPTVNSAYCYCCFSLLQGGRTRPCVWIVSPYPTGRRWSTGSRDDESVSMAVRLHSPAHHHPPAPLHRPAISGQPSPTASETIGAPGPAGHPSEDR